MARAHYALAYICLLSTLYLLLLNSVLPVPFVSKQASEEILPVVSSQSHVHLVLQNKSWLRFHGGFLSLSVHTLCLAWVGACVPLEIVLNLTKNS
jgi:hypothetical protein